MRLLVVVAHPDDESLWGGATIAMLTGLGVEVTVMCCSPEVTGPFGSDRREGEFHDACLLLGVKESRMLDGWGSDEALREMLTLEGVHRWEVVVTHSLVGELNLHADHRRVGQAVKAALRAQNWEGILVRFGVGTALNVQVLPSEDDRRLKTRAVLKHRTQTAFLSRMGFVDTPLEAFKLEKVT